MTKPSKNELILALSNAFKEGDLQFIETVSNISFGFKSELKRKAKAQCTEDL